MPIESATAPAGASGFMPARQATRTSRCRFSTLAMRRTASGLTGRGPSVRPTPKRPTRSSPFTPAISSATRTATSSGGSGTRPAVSSKACFRTCPFPAITSTTLSRKPRMISTSSTSRRTGVRDSPCRPTDRRDSRNRRTTWTYRASASSDSTPSRPRRTTTLSPCRQPGSIRY